MNLTLDKKNKTKFFFKRIALQLYSKAKISWDYYAYNNQQILKYKTQGLYLLTDLNNAALSRKCDYLAGRYCAKQVLEQFGTYNLTLNIDSDGVTSWPVNFIGSISHAYGLAIAAAGKDSQCKWLGLDIERLMPEHESKELIDYVMAPAELVVLRKYLFNESFAFILIFSAKESIYKAFYPTIKKFFGFEEVALISIDAIKQQLLFVLSKDISRQVEVDQVSVNYTFIDKYIITWCIDYFVN